MPARAHRLAIAAALAAALGAGCASPQRDAPATAPGAALHTRPSSRAMEHALARVADDATRCLAPGDPGARVEGAFDGPTGSFRASRVASSAGGAPLGFAAAGCVRDVAGRAHVRPFADATAAFEYTFAAPTATPVGAVPATGTSDYSQRISTPIANGTTPNERVRGPSDDYRRCYEHEALEREHTAGGMVEVHLVLDSRGAITRLTTRSESTFPDPTLMDLVARCIEQRVRTIAFGPQRDPGVEIVVPLAFSPESTP